MQNSDAPSRALSVYFLDARLSISGLLTDMRPISSAGILALCDSAATTTKIHTHNTVRSSQTVTSHSWQAVLLLSRVSQSVFCETPNTTVKADTYNLQLTCFALQKKLVKQFDLKFVKILKQFDLTFIKINSSPRRLLRATNHVADVLQMTRKLRRPSADILCGRPPGLWPFGLKIGTPVSTVKRFDQSWFMHLLAFEFRDHTRQNR